MAESKYDFEREIEVEEGYEDQIGVMNEEAYLKNQLKIMSQCIKECATAKIGAYLEEIKLQDGNIVNQLELSSKICEGPTALISITEKWVYLDLNFKFEKDGDLIVIKNMFDQYKKKETQFLTMFHQKGMASLYTLSINLIKEEKEKKRAFRINLVNPVFVAQEDNVLKFVFEMDGMNYGIDDVNYDEVEQEVAYETQGKLEDEENAALRKEIEKDMIMDAAERDEEEDDELEESENHDLNNYETYGDKLAKGDVEE